MLRVVISRKNWLILAAGVLIGAGVGFALLLVFGSGGWLLRALGWSQVDSSPVLFPEVDSPAQDFALYNLEGETVRLSEQRGKTVILNFWATWCGPCRIEMPLFQQYYERYSSNLQVLAVNYDEPKEEAQAFVQELGLSFPTLLDPGGEVVNQYRVRGFPTTFIIDPEGVVRYQHIGLMEEDQLQGYLEKVGFEP